MKALSAGAPTCTFVVLIHGQLAGLGQISRLDPYVGCPAVVRLLISNL